MTDPTITVRGEYTALLAPEQAKVSLTVAQDGPQRESVVAAAAGSADQLTQIITTARDRTGSPVVSWTSDAVHVWAERPWASDGVQHPPIHHASVRFTVLIRDFDVLAGFIDEVASMTDVTVEGVAWLLTDQTRLAALEDVRTRAVQDAVHKATVYARSIGLHTVRATALADAGMLLDDNRPSARVEQSAMLRTAKASAPGLSFQPDDIEVSAAVDARFLAT